MYNNNQGHQPTRSTRLADRGEINTLYYESLCCAIVFGDLKNFPLQVKGKMEWGEKLRPHFYEWFSKKCIPQDLKRYYEKSYVIPQSIAFLKEAKFSINDYNDRFFDNLRGVEAQYLIGRFRELKFSTPDFTDFRNTCKQRHPECWDSKQFKVGKVYDGTQDIIGDEPDETITVEAAPKVMKHRNFFQRVATYILG